MIYAFFTETLYFILNIEIFQIINFACNTVLIDASQVAPNRAIPMPLTMTWTPLTLNKRSKDNIFNNSLYHVIAEILDVNQRKVQQTIRP